MAHFSYLDNKMKNTSISLFQSISTILKLLVFATLCVPLVCWWRRQWGWITRPFHGSPTIGSGQTSDQLLHMPHNCHFYWTTYTNFIFVTFMMTRSFHGSLPIGSGQTSGQVLHILHICHFLDGDRIKERLFQCIGCSPQRLTNIFIGLWHTYKSKTSGQSIYRFHQNLSSFVF